MSDVEDVLRAVLRADASVAGLVGERIFHEVLPEAAQVPAVVINRLSTEPVRAMAADAPLKSSRFQIDVFAERQAQSRTVANAVRDALPRGGTAGPPVVQAIFFNNEYGVFDAATRRYQRVIDVTAWWEEN